MTSSLSSLANAVSLADEISKPTEVKETVSKALEGLENSSNLNPFGNDFAPVEPEPTPVPVFEFPDPIEEEPYDPEKNARALVNTLLGIDALVLNGVVFAKARSKAGGKKGMERMKKAREKEYSGTELTDSDKANLKRFEDYKRDLDLLGDSIFVSEPVKKQLIEAAIDYCTETKFEMSASTAFWASYGSNLIERTTRIIFK